MPSNALALVDITEFQTFEACWNLGQISIRYNKNRNQAYKIKILHFD